MAWMYVCWLGVFALTTLPRPTGMPSVNTPDGEGTFSRTICTT